MVVTIVVLALDNSNIGDVQLTLATQIGIRNYDNYNLIVANNYVTTTHQHNT